MVDIEFWARESFATVLAGVLISREHVETAEADLSLGNPIICDQENDSWHADHPISQVDCLIM
jgi:hypothetical protein